MVVTNNDESLENRVSRLQRIGHGIKTTKEYVDKNLPTINPVALGAMVGITSGLTKFGWIYLINHDGDIGLAGWAALKSGVWAFGSTLVNVPLCKKFSEKYEQPLAMLLGVGVPVSISFSAYAFSYHFFGKLDHPLLTTVCATGLAIPGFIYLSWDVIKQKRIREHTLTDYIE